MDVVFSLPGEADRTNYLRSLLHSFGCTYICVWLYYPQSNHLRFLDGHYNEENNNQPAGSSSGSLARRLFDGYRRESFYIINDHIPGIAFINNQPYRELNQSDLLRFTSVAVQRQFYQEARIKTAVFMGCTRGEIEMGWSNSGQMNMNMENAMMSWFSEYNNIPQAQSQLRDLDPTRPSSSSSSLRSLDSPDSSPFMFNYPTTSHMPEVVPLEVHSLPIQQALQSLQPSTSTSIEIQQVLHSLQPIQSTTSPLLRAMQSQQPASPLHPHPQTKQQVLQGTTSPFHQQFMQSLHTIRSTASPLHEAIQASTSTSTSSHQQAMQAFALSRNIHLPTQESEDAVMTRAILAVLTSASTSSSTPNIHIPVNQQRASAFKGYLAPKTPTTENLSRQSMLTRSITYYKGLNLMRREHMMTNRPSSTQLHHMIMERKRREKINESFDALRKLLPAEAKKDKASVLTRTREYLALLRTQVTELSERNQQLEAQLLPAPAEETLSSDERVNVRITNVSESTSEEERLINLQVVLRGECPISDLVIRTLEFLKQVNNVNLISLEANTTGQESRSSATRIIMTLRIEGNEWDEDAFQEAVRRVVTDLAQ